MRSPTFGRALLLPAVLFVVLACTTPSASPTPVGRIEIGTFTNGDTFVPWHDGDVVPTVWGPQGGVMITPSVTLDGALVTGSYPALVVQLDNLVLPALTPVDGFGTYGPTMTLFARVGPRVIGGPIYDQLAWSPVSGPLRVRAHVTGMGVDVMGQVDVVLGDAGSSPPDAGSDAP